MEILLDIDKKLFIWVHSVESDCSNPTRYRLKLDTFGNGWGWGECCKYEGSAFFLNGEKKVEKKIKIGRETSARKGVSWWLDVDSCPAGSFLLTEEKNFVCIYDGKVDFNPNESFSLQLKNQNIRQYLIRSDTWFGVLDFHKKPNRHNVTLIAFSFPEFNLRSDLNVISVDDDDLRGSIKL